MSAVVEVSPAWLARREAEDARARSRTLVRRARALLPTGPLRVHDLGSGTGSMMRWLAPQLPGPQTWTLHDWNADLPARAVDADPARDPTVAPVAIRTRIGPLADLRGTDLAGASLVTASALLDVLTVEEARAVVAACVAVGAPALFTLSVTGQVELRPPDARDESYRAAFNAHQRREASGRRLLGPGGGDVVARLFADAGWTLATAPSPWRLGPANPTLLAEWFAGWADAAEEHDPALATPLLAAPARIRPGVAATPESYRALRTAQIERGALTATVPHTDVLAWP